MTTDPTVTSTLGELMAGFADRTGLADAAGPPRRYLWTDAFAVCNFLELFRRTGEDRHLENARRLVDEVHHVLGRHRRDDPRRGWISGLEDAEGERHPTAGGLRIGKELNERAPGDPYDDRLEWDRDGQYYHYLVKWMHALARMARVTDEAQYHRWAVELATAAHAGFAHGPPGGGPTEKRLSWKMSIDLSRPLVPSMGRHDPLDGLVTCWQLRAGAAKSGEDALEPAIADLAGMCDGASWATTDPLGIGGLLTDAGRLAQLVARSGLPEADRLAQLLDDADASLGSRAATASLDAPVSRRLAFRELGLSIGLHAVGLIRDLLERHPDAFPNQQALEKHLSRLARFLPVGESIEHSWRQPNHQKADSWLAHREINTVMLATSLGPEAFLRLG